MNIPGWSTLNAEQQALIEWQYRFCGDFKKALWEAICRADEGNLERLKQGFPVEVSAYLKFSRLPNYWRETVKLAGGDIEAGY